MSKGTTSFTWTRGRLLQSVNNATYTYDKNGIRCKKVNGAVTTDYFYEGNNLIFEKRSNLEKPIYYFYDESGVCGMRYNNVNYEFVRNIFGDVIAIYQGNTCVAEYCYDAWGNCKITNYGLNIAAANPFRYRGYYYDSDSCLYYLLSRYYDPAIGQFISPDTFDYLDPETIGGVNLYAYCNNNPMMYSDPTGHWDWGKFLRTLAVVAVAAVAVATVAAVTVATGGTALPVIASAGIGCVTSAGVSVATQIVTTGEVDLAQVIVDGVLGGITGAFGGSTIGLLGMGVANGITGFAGSLASDYVDGTFDVSEPTMWGFAVVTGLISGGLGCLSGGGAQNGINSTYKGKLQLRKEKIGKGKRVKSLDLEIKNEKNQLIKKRCNL